MTTQNSDENPGTKYLYITRYEVETSGDLESNGAGSIKNFPRTFIPMKELEESAPAE
jgi:hypothetical protein